MLPLVSKALHLQHEEQVMSHILFLSRYYTPEKAAAAVCVHETAKRLATMGHQVTVLTTVPNYPTGIIPKEYRGHSLQEEIIEGVRVLRVWSYVSPNKGFLKRILSQLSFGCLAPLLGGRAVGSPDILIVESPPLFNVIAAHVLAWWKRCPFIFWVADLWPESAVQLGVLKNRTFIKLAEWLEWTTYRRAALVWTVTEGMQDTLLKRGLAPEHLILIHNGVDTTRFRPYPQQHTRHELGWGKEFTVLYTGTHGLTHGLMTVLDAAERLREHVNVRFVLVGDGAEKEKLIRHAKQRQLENVLFLYPIPHELVPILLAAADVCLAHTRKLPLFEGMMPMKMYEAMACGRPLLLALNGEARRIAEQEAGAAFYVEPENAEALAAAVLHLYEHPELREQLGLQGRTYVRTHFDYDHLTAQVEAQLYRFQAMSRTSRRHTGINLFSVETPK
jgi:colanic acid biosynthesis glycosyl transferase WcaI